VKLTKPGMPATSATEATAKTLLREPKAQNTVVTAWLTAAEITGTIQTQAAEGKPATARIPATIGVFLQDSLLDITFTFQLNINYRFYHFNP